MKSQEKKNHFFNYNTLSMGSKKRREKMKKVEWKKTGKIRRGGEKKKGRIRRPINNANK